MIFIIVKEFWIWVVLFFFLLDKRVDFKTWNGSQDQEEESKEISTSLLALVETPANVVHFGK